MEHLRTLTPHDWVMGWIILSNLFVLAWSIVDGAKDVLHPAPVRVEANRTSQR